MTQLHKRLSPTNLALIEQHVISVKGAGRGIALTHNPHTCALKEMRSSPDLFSSVWLLGFIPLHHCSAYLCFLLPLLSVSSANSDYNRSKEWDSTPFLPPNESLMCCGTAGSGCQNSGLCSKAGQLFWRVLDWISASDQPTQSHTNHTAKETVAGAVQRDLACRADYSSDQVISHDER